VWEICKRIFSRGVVAKILSFADNECLFPFHSRRKIKLFAVFFSGVENVSKKYFSYFCLDVSILHAEFVQVKR